MLSDYFGVANYRVQVQLVITNSTVQKFWITSRKKLSRPNSNTRLKVAFSVRNFEKISGFIFS